MSTLTIQQITNESLKILEKELDYWHKPQYKMRCAYGKYTIYKIERAASTGHRTTTLAKRLSKEQAEGMMKLLESDDE